jgi:hypothetical protein
MGTTKREALWRSKLGIYQLLCAVRADEGSGQNTGMTPSDWLELHKFSDRVLSELLDLQRELGGP